MATDWTSIRVRRGTAERLRRVVRSLERACETGQYSPAALSDQGITLDEALSVLLDRDERHRERRRRSAKESRRYTLRPEAGSASVEG